jgi:nucleoid-associated protein YgaU
LIILFLIALGVIAIIGGKYFNNSTTNNTSVPQQVQTKQIETKSAVEQEVQKENIAKTNQSQQQSQEVQQQQTQQAESNEINELEKIVQEQEKPKESSANSQAQTPEQQTIAKVATSASGGKALSQEELAKIDQLVAQELAKAKTKKVTNSAPAQKQQNATNNEEDLIASLQSAQTDTLKNEDINTQELKDTQVKSNTTNKKVDTFNKVIVQEKKGGDDEIAKLSAEIDSILQTKEVAKKEQTLKYGKELKQEIASREKAMRFIVVKPGDTLSSLAYKAYGRASAYVKIYKANPDLIKNPNRIYVGMKLRVPVDEEYINNQGN